MCCVKLYYEKCIPNYVQNKNRTEIFSIETSIEESDLYSDEMERITSRLKEKYKFVTSDVHEVLNPQKEDKNKLDKIKKIRDKDILIISFNKELFTNFYRDIYVIDERLNEQFIYSDIDEVIESLVNNDITKVNKVLDSFFKIYDNVFEINLEALIKGTTFQNKNDDDKITKEKLLRIIQDDIKLFEYKNIFTSRLSIILYRLCFFDLDAKTAGIGRFFSEKLNTKSKSYCFKNINNNTKGYFFNSSFQKPFRGYKIEAYRSQGKFTEYNLIYINIAKKLLKLNVKMKIVSEALEIDEKELTEIIYGESTEINGYPFDNKEYLDIMFGTRKK